MPVTWTFGEVYQERCGRNMLGMRLFAGTVYGPIPSPRHGGPTASLLWVCLDVGLMAYLAKELWSFQLTSYRFCSFRRVFK